MKRVEADGWFQMRQRGSHSQYHHEVKPGAVTISGHPGDDLPRALERRIVKQAGLWSEMS